MGEGYNLLIMGAVFGLVYGILLQKGDFCFVSAFRDWFSFRHRRVLHGVILAVLVALLGWSLALAAGWAPLERLWLPPVGWSSLLGSILFGVGMYVAGACVSGTLYRSGMGYSYFWLVFLGMKVGYLFYAYLHEPFFELYYFEPLFISRPITLYEYISPTIVFTVTSLLIIALAVKWLLSDREETNTRRNDRDVESSGNSSANPLRWKSWDARLVGILIGIVVTVQFSLWSIWGITGPGTRIAGVVWSRVVGESFALENPYMVIMFAPYPEPMIGPAEVLILFIIIGAALSSLIGGTFRFRKPRLQRVPNAVLGGFIMGLGSRMAPGCNIGNIISGLPALSVHSMVATLGIALGVYIAYTVAQRNLQKQMDSLEAKQTER